MQRAIVVTLTVLALGSGCIGGGKSDAKREGFTERAVTPADGLDTDIDFDGECVRRYRVGRDGRAGASQHYSVTVQLADPPKDEGDLGRALARPACEGDMRRLQQRILEAHAVAAPFGSYVTMWFSSSGDERLIEP